MVMLVHCTVETIIVEIQWVKSTEFAAEIEGVEINFSILDVVMIFRLWCQGHSTCLAPNTLKYLRYCLFQQV